MTHEEMMARGRTTRDGAATIERIDPRLLAGEDTYIFNIYDAEHFREPGIGGTFYIPACPEGKEWVRAPRSIAGTVEDIYPHFSDKEEYRVRPTPGEEVVKAILGIASGNSPQEDIRRLGIFASHSSKPTKEELATAKGVLVKGLQAEMLKADRLFSSADPMDRKSVESQHFFKAARYLGTKKPWMHETQQMTVCPFCNVGVSPVASKCHGCNEVINHAAYEAQKKMISGAA